ncbi:MAG: peptidoglycan-associated lipoprotein Pal [Pseudomonadales bacterium]|nr:peptidoglycan-associated lipoprotein Pal [Pseudomonadales bacterium]
MDKSIPNPAEDITDDVYYFEYDQSSINADTSDALDVVATALKNTTATVRLEGHADERGTREYNMALGERRANSVKRYLTAQGVMASQIEVISYGEENPVTQGSEENLMVKNRRVELKTTASL